MHRRSGAHSVSAVLENLAVGSGGQIQSLSPTLPETTMNTSTPATGLRGLIAVAIFGAIASSFSAVSAADPQSVSITVKYADLNIASPSGARVLYERIRAAAQAGCGYFLFETDADEARCVHDAIATAVIKVNQPALSAVFDARFKVPARTTLVSQNR
jgi:UrcA family protein